jgi:hypothetical protein
VGDGAVGFSSHFYPQELLEDGRRNKKKGKRKERERLRVGKKKKEKKEKLFSSTLFGRGLAGEGEMGGD